MINNAGDKKIMFGMMWRFGEKITAQLVSFAVSVVLARLLMPEDYGIVAIVNVFISITEVFVTSGLGTSLIQKKDADEVDFSTLFWCNILLSFMLYAVMFFAAPFIADFYEMPMLTHVLRVFGLRLPVMAINSIQNAFVSRRMDFKKFFFATIMGTIASAIIGITMAYAGFGVWALVAQYLTNSIIDTIALFFIIKWYPHFVFSSIRARPLMSYGVRIMATDFIGAAFNQVNSFVIGKKYSSSDLAYYTQGKKIPDLLNNNIGSTLCAVLFPALSLSNDINEIKCLRRKSLKMIEYILFPIMFGIATVADKMITVLLTKKWEFTIPFVRIACISSIIGILGTTLIQEIKAIGRSDVTFKMELIKKPIFLVILLIAMHYGVIAIAWTAVVNEIIAFCFNVYPVKKYIGFDIKLHVLDAVPPLLMSAVMAIIVYIIGLFIFNDLVCLFVQVLSGGIIYLILSIITKNDSFLYLISIKNQYIK